MSNSVEYEDLLGLRWEAGAMKVGDGALDCAGVAAEVLHRINGPHVRDEFLKALRGLPHDWRELDGDEKPEVGDLVLSHGRRGLHCSVVVEASPALAISSTDPIGCYVLRVSDMSAVQGLYRFAG